MFRYLVLKQYSIACELDENNLKLMFATPLNGLSKNGSNAF